ncbi:MAG: NBR1-Ig-like domain-containing protein [Anaerolineae bacterium]|jgi:hypothetical protein
MKWRKLNGMALVVALHVLVVSACGPRGGARPSITITSPASGTTVQVGEEVEIVSTASSEAGVERVELSINGQVVRRDTPPSGNPTTFSIVQPWTPMVEGQATVLVVVYDTEGEASDPVSIALRVEAGVAEVTPTPVPDVEGEGGCSLNASFVADVTVPDDTEMASGEPFVKTWRFRNSGTCDWGPGFGLVFVSGDAMGGPGSVAVPATAAGSTADVSVNLTAPSDPGTYRGNWRMRSDEGLRFGSTVYVQIVVPEEPTEVPTEEPEPPTNLQATVQPDDTLLFTWDDAVGEVGYKYEFSFAAGGLGVATTNALPADTTSWNAGTLSCGGEGDFTIIALAEGDSEIGQATISFDTPDCGPMMPPILLTPLIPVIPSLPNFDAAFVNVHDCIGHEYATFSIENTGPITLEWMRLHIQDLDTSGSLYGPGSNSAPFVADANGCPPGASQLDAGDTAYIAASIGSPPSGHSAQATIKLCTEDGGGGSCLEKTVDFTIP